MFLQNVKAVEKIMELHLWTTEPRQTPEQVKLVLEHSRFRVKLHLHLPQLHKAAVKKLKSSLLKLYKIFTLLKIFLPTTYILTIIPDLMTEGDIPVKIT